MAERKAVNKYYPPDWRPEMGSINKYRNSHPLRDRARKLKDGILIIRFELPYNIWCGGCGKHVGMGVRYNAEKKKVGNYYTTPIWRFRMKCHLCDNHFEIETDPKNCDYVIVSGATRKEERWNDEDTGTVRATAAEEKERLAKDAIYRLEHGVADVKKAKSEAPRLEQLEEMQAGKRDDFALNQLARKKFRAEKHHLKAAETVVRNLQMKGSLTVPLLPERSADIHTAKAMPFRRKADSFKEFQAQKRIKIQSRPILDQAGPVSERTAHMTTLLQKTHRAGLSHRNFLQPKLSASCIASQPLVTTDTRSRVDDTTERAAHELSEDKCDGEASCTDKTSNSGVGEHLISADCSFPQASSLCGLVADYSASDSSSSDENDSDHR